MTAKTILAYYRASLADGERMDIRAKTVVMQGAAFPAGAEDWGDCSAKLFKGLDDKIKNLAVLIAPWKLKSRTKDGQ